MMKDETVQKYKAKKKTLQPSKADTEKYSYTHTKPLFFLSPCQDWLRQKEILPNKTEEWKKIEKNIFRAKWEV